jgi:diadenosine tetraphosphate (Ap4A) HIT family hydrolase
MQREVYLTDGFIVMPCSDCDVPGYLVLIAREEKVTLADLPFATQAELGGILARLESALRTICGAEHVYVLRFSEGLSVVHFHVFPRTQKLAQQWLADAEGCDEMNGPHLFAWARSRYRVEQPQHLSVETLHIADRIRKFLVMGDGSS